VHPRTVVVAVWISVIGSGAPAGAQLIPIRTVPVASGDQFRFLPSMAMGMRGVHYALDDSLADGWRNPAMGTLLPETSLSGSPTFYGISGDQGGGRSFPVSGVAIGSRWFGGFAFALQQIENAERASGFGWIEPALDLACCSPPPSDALSDRLGRNLYGSAFVGRDLGSRWSVGVGVSGMALDAMDGVDLLYAGANRIEQSGSVTDLRLGAFRKGDTGRLALLVGHHRVSMDHDVTYADWTWDDQGMVGRLQERIERIGDESRTWLAQATWDRELDASGWRVAAVGGINFTSHPEIPNYSIQNIPRDPGTTWAYEVGVGVAITEGPSTFALDIALQPIWSSTWQEAVVEDVIASGGRLSVGDRSVENEFFFTNALLRGGVAHRVGVVGLQAGIEMKSIDYDLEQVDRVDDTFRDQRESWMEWTPTLGASFAFAAIHVRYALRVTTGTGRPGTAPPERPEAVAMGDADFLVAPDGPLTLEDARVVTHQVAVTIPVR
jgi:hypothetical protein